MRHWYVLPIVIVLAILPFGIRQIKLHQKEVATAKLNASMQKAEESVTLGQEHAKKAEALIARSKKSLAEAQKQLDEYYNRPVDALEPILYADVAKMRQWLDEVENRPADALEPILYSDLAEMKQLSDEMQERSIEVMSILRQIELEFGEELENKPASALLYNNR